ncbi:hypothetical protein D3C83_07590 [compost metagenome]
MAVRSTPIAPAAPVRLSAMTCWPHVSESFWAMVRAVVSVPAPAANGTMKRTGLLGKSFAGSGCAAASGRARLAPAQASAAVRTVLLSLCIMFPPVMF